MLIRSPSACHFGGFTLLCPRGLLCSRAGEWSPDRLIEIIDAELAVFLNG